MSSFLSDFNGPVTDSIESVLRQGAKKEGRYRGQWREDTDIKHHVHKAIGHLGHYLAHGIDKDTGEPHLSNAVARILIALHHHFEGKKI